MKQTEKTLAGAAAKAGMSEKTARKYLASGKLPSQMKKTRDWQTRKDPFDEVWPEIKAMLVVDPGLQAALLHESARRVHLPERRI